ncbi:MAG: type II secretion system F family protein [Thaumarchaeota archaeon]|nr:type II secretion system F family protein [Nitrososphaerota archaeon]
MQSQQTEAPKQKKNVVLTRYRRFAYFFFKWYDNKPRPGTLETLYKAGIQMLPGMYVGTIVVTSVLAGTISLAGCLFFFTFVFPTPFGTLITLGVAGGAAAAGAIAFPMMTVNKITAKRVSIDSNLPFLLAYMATLSSAGMNPIDTLRAIALKDFGAISAEFRKIVYRFDVLGEDVVSAINHIATNTPSSSLHDILVGISNIVVSGGSIRAYCEQQSVNLFADKKAKLKSFIDSLASLSEGYVGGVIVTIVMAVIGIILLGSLGIKVLPFLDTQDIFELFIFFIVPFINIIFLVMLTLRFSTGEY